MPVIYVCRSCGAVLYRFDKVGGDTYGVPTPSEVLRMVGSRCPRCGRELRPPTVNDIEVCTA